MAVVYVTVPSEEAGRAMARSIVKERLAACVNIVPRVISIYEWKQQVEEDSEAMLIIKTSASSVQRLSQFVKQHHTYEVPEVIAIPIVDGSETYLNWVRGQMDKARIDSGQEGQKGEAKKTE